jgi:hypothetical protein
LEQYVSNVSAYGQGAYSLEIGLWGTVIGLASMALGAIADAISKD